jgi:hypothetical protein
MHWSLLLVVSALVAVSATPGYDRILAEYHNLPGLESDINLLPQSHTSLIPCIKQRRYQTSDPTTGGGMNPLFASVGRKFEAYAKRGQLVMGFDNCFVLNIHHGEGVTDDSLFTVFSAGKLNVDQALVSLIDGGELNPEWTLRYALLPIMPDFGRDGAENITVAQFMQFQGRIAVMGTYLSLEDTQHNKTDGTGLINSLRFIRPTNLPKPDGINWYPNPNNAISNKTLDHQYNPLAMGWIAKALIEARNPGRLPLDVFMNSPRIRGVITQAITRPNNGLMNRSQPYELYYRFPADRTDLWARHIPPTPNAGVVRPQEPVEALYSAAQADGNSVEQKMLLVTYPFLGLITPYPALGITIPLIADPLNGDINNPAFAVRTNALTLGAWAMNGASKGQVTGNSRFLSASISAKAIERVSNATDLTMWATGANRSYARYGGLKPVKGAISSCLPEDTVISNGLSDCFWIYAPSIHLSLAMTTADFGAVKGFGKELSPLGLAVVDEACRLATLYTNLLLL